MEQVHNAHVADQALKARMDYTAGNETVQKDDGNERDDEIKDNTVKEVVQAE